jgi:hypothetical protein
MANGTAVTAPRRNSNWMGGDCSMPAMLVGFGAYDRGG